MPRAHQETNVAALSIVDNMPYDPPMSAIRTLKGITLNHMRGFTSVAACRPGFQDMACLLVHEIPRGDCDTGKTLDTVDRLYREIRK